MHMSCCPAGCQYLRDIATTRPTNALPAVGTSTTPARGGDANADTDADTDADANADANADAALPICFVVALIDEQNCFSPGAHTHNTYPYNYTYTYISSAVSEICVH